MSAGISGSLLSHIPWNQLGLRVKSIPLWGGFGNPVTPPILKGVGEPPGGFSTLSLMCPTEI